MRRGEIKAGVDEVWRAKHEENCRGRVRWPLAEGQKAEFQNSVTANQIQPRILHTLVSVPERGPLGLHRHVKTQQVTSSFYYYGAAVYISKSCKYHCLGRSCSQGVPNVGCPSLKSFLRRSFPTIDAKGGVFSSEFPSPGQSRSTRALTRSSSLLNHRGHNTVSLLIQGAAAENWTARNRSISCCIPTPLLPPRPELASLHHEQLEAR